MKLFALLTLLCALGSSLGAEPRDRELSQLKAAKRILFLGDSITYAGTYIDYIQTWLALNCPAHRYEIIDCGLPSETVSGLTEPGHAGGAFPRPVLSERLDRVLNVVKPDLVFACYGMNDGMYYPFAEERFAKYRSGIEDLAAKVAGAHARLILITPPPFDSVPIKSSTLPAGRDEYRQPYEGYDDVLTRYSSWLVDQRKHGWKVIDIHTPVRAYLDKRRSTDPGFRLAGDGVHLNGLGHWLIADTVLTFLGARTSATRLVLDLPPDKSKGGVADSRSPAGEASLITCPVCMPVANDLTAGERHAARARYDVRTLSVRGLRWPRVTLLVESRDVGIVSADELRLGVSLLDVDPRLTETASTRLIRAVSEKRAMLADAYLNASGHKRPGMSTGLPLSEALATAEKQEEQITALARPQHIEVRLVPTNR